MSWETSISVGAKPSRKNSTGLMSRSLRISRTRTLTGWARTAAAVDLSRSARVVFRVLPIGFIRSLDSIRAKEHSDLKREDPSCGSLSTEIVGRIQSVSAAGGIDGGHRTASDGGRG